MNISESWRIWFIKRTKVKIRMPKRKGGTTSFMIYRSKNLNTLFLYYRKALKKSKALVFIPGPYGFNQKGIGFLPRYTNCNETLHVGLMNQAPTPRNDTLHEGLMNQTPTCFASKAEFLIFPIYTKRFLRRSRINSSTC